jgi:hypothetical protein
MVLIFLGLMAIDGRLIKKVSPWGCKMIIMNWATF